MAVSKCVKLTGALTQELLKSVDNVLFDCDGVLWHGDSAIAGASEVVKLLRKKNKRVFFVTNNSTKTQELYAQKLCKMGFEAVKEEVFGTAHCTALYLKQVACFNGGKVYLIGGKALSEELDKVGISYVGPGPDPVFGGMSDWASVPLDPDVKAVVVGFDEHFSYLKLTKALCYLKDPGCLFIGTNTDTKLPLEGGRAVPGTGCLIRAVETAVNRKAIIIGKPSKFIYDCVVSKYGVDPARTVMVGDRLDTDILLGSNCNLKTVLTLTGVTSLVEAQSCAASNCPEERRLAPDFYIDTIGDLLPALQG
ncbi:glycerol-3-phosphate phosphatase [Protopterus annectens]|uniref:glycerol-3-phosphate phosphatase n=1 Tax=Protopterus annectens TaxID=7888 RepID=UPI001CF9C82A|nr:glycerol-3-phosphate phosphatase [Protopterus annectens]